MRTRGWLIDGVVGGVAGGVVGAVAAVNIVIFTGIDGGYEASLPEVFRQSPAVGVVTVLVLLAGPVFGVLGMRRLRRKRDLPKAE